ncbi:tyrosine-protein kinase-like otk [Poecilia latipinna]|uniref:tyrosine-protein kinase-like otk n=1 Tax=Poecilia latipinna TaxID=48699 RepID=UPI00072E6FE4|nr:PREDICTED: tyrosine-protein kinase-like otk [Poecilia latipinna]
MYLQLILMLTATAAAGQQPSQFTVRVGDEVTLPCKDVTDGQNKCDGTTWSFIRSASVTLFEAGNINLTIPDRLSVTVNCSLVIKKVSMEDVGHYTCRQLTSGQEGPNSSVYLSVVHLTEQKINDSVVLNCSVVDYEIPRHTVEWLYEGETSSDSKSLPPVFRSTVILTTSLHQNSTFFSSIKCNVTNISTKEVQLFTFSHQSTDQDTGHKADHNTGFLHVLYVLRCIVVSVGLAALLTSVITVNMKTKNKTQRHMDDNEDKVMEENAENPDAVRL